MHMFFLTGVFFYITTIIQIYSPLSASPYCTINLLYRHYTGITCNTKQATKQFPFPVLSSFLFFQQVKQRDC
jgi:hypothetical protein